MIRNRNIQAPSDVVTTDAAEFLTDKRMIWFHDRIRGAVFTRGPAHQPLPHRYMRGVIRSLPKALRPKRYQ